MKMIIDLTIDITIIISYLFLMGMFSRLVHKKEDYPYIFSRIWPQLNAGILLGILGIILMYFSIHVNEQVIVDLRHISTVLGAVFFGAPAAIVSSVIIGISRMVLFGSINPVSILAMASMVMIGFICALLSRLDLRDSVKFTVLNLLSILIIYLTLYWNLAIFTFDREVLSTIYSIHWIFSLIGGLFAFHVMKYIFNYNVLISELSKSNLELEESNSRLHSLITNLNSGILVEKQDRRVALVNQEFHHIFGIPLSEKLIDMDCRLLIDAAKEAFKDRDLFSSRIEEILKDREIVVQEKLELSDGRILERDYIPVYSNQGEWIGHLWNYRDVTHREKNQQERKEIENKLMESEQQYKSLFEYNQSATFSLDLEGHFKNVNHSAESITGYSKEELIGSSFVPFISKSSLSLTHNFFKKIIQRGESGNFETELIHKDGRIVNIQVNAAPIIVRDEIIGAIGVAHDISQQKEAESRLKQSENRYKTLIHLSPEVIFVHSKSKIEFINDKALAFIGANDKSEILGKSVFDFLHPDDRYISAYNMALGFSNSDEFPEFNDLRFIRMDGEVVTANVGAKMIEYNGEQAMIGVIHDITKQKQVEQKLKEANEMLLKLSQLDGLTGIPNRRFYEDTFDKEWKAAIRNKKPISVILLDIDCFKAYNDTYGHQQGDYCLKQVANVLQSTISRPKDFVARYGGEEFSVILPETDETGAAFVAELLRSNVEKLNIPHSHSKVKPIVTISLGAATTVPSADSNEQDLIRKADEALYRAKRNGRNQAVLYDSWNLIK